MVDDAAARGVELLVLPELWCCGYDPETLPEDAVASAEPLDGPRSERLAEAARDHDLWLAAGSVPELGGDGKLYDTAIVFNPRGELTAWHRKAHLYPPTRETAVFSAGDRLTTFEDPSLGVVGLVVCFDGDFPEVARTLALRGARLIVAPSAYEVEGATAWDLLYPALALTNSQWWVQSNQVGSHSTSTLLGASRIVAPTGTVVAEPAAPYQGAWARPSCSCTASTCTWPTGARASPRCSRTSAAPPSTTTGCRLVPEQGRRGVEPLLPHVRLRLARAVGRVAAMAAAGPMRGGNVGVSLYEGLISTRAIRRYTDEAVPDEALRDILFAATRAPSGSNRQPFRFVVLTDGPVAREAKRLIGEGARRFWATKREADGYDKGSGADATSPKARWRAPCSTTSTRTSRYPSSSWPASCPTATPVTATARRLPRLPEPAVGRRALGYGGVLTNWQFAADAELPVLLHIPDGVESMATITLGRPRGHHGPGRRRPLRELVYGERWEEPPAWAVDPAGATHTAAGPPSQTQ